MQVTLPFVSSPLPPSPPKARLILKTFCHLNTSGLWWTMSSSMQSQHHRHCHHRAPKWLPMSRPTFFPVEVKRIPCYRKLTSNSFLQNKGSPAFQIPFSEPVTTALEPLSVSQRFRDQIWKARYKAKLSENTSRVPFFKCFENTIKHNLWTVKSLIFRWENSGQSSSQSMSQLCETAMLHIYRALPVRTIHIISIPLHPQHHLDQRGERCIAKVWYSVSKTTDALLAGLALYNEPYWPFQSFLDSYVDF